MKTALVIMTGIAFTLGVVFGLLLQLPIDNTLSADSARPLNHRLSGAFTFRSRRSLSKGDGKLRKQLELTISNSTAIFNEKWMTKSKSFKRKFVESLERPEDVPTELKLLNQKRNVIETVTSDTAKRFNSDSTAKLHHEIELRELGKSPSDLPDSHNSIQPRVVTIQLNAQKGSQNMADIKKAHSREIIHSSEDVSYLSDLVAGVYWTSRLENSCPTPFHSGATEAWRRQAQTMDVVKMDEGCGRMQNRLVTFRDASKACARYRLNTDQIQGEIFSYYLSRLLNVSNIPPTILVQVDALAPKWRTVHIQLSLAQWADSKLVVLTQHIDGLSPAHIPIEFQEEGRRLEPTLAALGSKTHAELCELVQWSDLIIFDYLTANLDRVINNMFNRQWNDQMMSSPAHNLEQRPDGSLVFLDNESGLFHGYRLLDKYAGFHQSLLGALCVFRPGTAEAVKRLHKASNIGKELHTLFSFSEALHKRIAAIPEKNLKILQQRLDNVHDQILNCERLFNR